MYLTLANIKLSKNISDEKQQLPASTILMYISLPEANTPKAKLVPSDEICLMAF